MRENTACEMTQLYAKSSSIDPTNKDFSGMPKTLIFINDTDKSMTILLYSSVKYSLFMILRFSLKT